MAPKPNGMRPWVFLDNGQHTDWDDARRSIDSFTDRGANASAKWKMLPGGEAGHRRVFSCNAHVDCPVLIRLVRKSNLDLVLEKVAGFKHTTEVQLLDRSNAALSEPHKAEVITALAYGATALRVVQKLSTEALNAGAKLLSTEDDEAPGVEGAS